MKRLIFIDNDNSKRANTDLEEHVLPFLQDYCNIKMSDIEIMASFYKMERTQELFDILYSDKNAILTWSVYTPAPMHNSKTQLLSFLKTAGTSNVKNATYIDASCHLERMLYHALRFDDIKGKFEIMKAIETNNIITMESIGTEFIRLRLDLTAEKAFKYEKVNLSKLLSIKK